MRILRHSTAVFANGELEKNFNSMDENDEIKIYLKRAIQDIQNNAFCGIQLPKRLIPREYAKKYRITNLWKYDIPDGWRLIYSITTPNKIEIISVILEWFDHKNYERKFGYR